MPSSILELDRAPMRWWLLLKILLCSVLAPIRPLPRVSVTLNGEPMQNGRVLLSFLSFVAGQW